MTSTTTLLERNRLFSEKFGAAELPILPKLRSVVLTCGDARVDPAHVLGLELGDAVVIRNNGGRVTREALEEIASLVFLVRQMEGGKKGHFELVLMQHTQCGSERFASPEIQHALKENLGIDVSETAIHDHEQSLKEDIQRLKAASEIPDYVIVSALIYDVKTGSAREIVAPRRLGDIVLD
ncbi:MAG: hypothetical protein K5905_31220 [Roseibium sp.]|uniref:carbonic anhydrase n=1 Tax=Roseibium sp. TaxID=1936156 RepID=UPI0026278293|nr:carbonic anhydrase [Roseibium sp.]MCV0429928.1 hypothetical protein [Roseibium sp.]